MKGSLLYIKIWLWTGIILVTAMVIIRGITRLTGSGLSKRDGRATLVNAETKKGISKFILPLNFGGLEQGEYSIEITDETGTQIQKVNHATENAVNAAAKAVHISKMKDGKYLVSATTSGNINVQIFDGNDNLIHSKNFDVNGKLAVVYNLKNVEGQPSFLVK